MQCAAKRHYVPIVAPKKHRKSMSRDQDPLVSRPGYSDLDEHFARQGRPSAFVWTARLRNTIPVLHPMHFDNVDLSTLPYPVTFRHRGEGP